MSKIRLFYSSKQREISGENYYDEGICKFLNPITGKYEPYTEMRSDGGSSNFDDAVCVYEGDEEPKIKNKMDLKLEKIVSNATNGRVKIVGKNDIKF